MLRNILFKFKLRSTSITSKPYSPFMNIHHMFTYTCSEIEIHSTVMTHKIQSPTWIFVMCYLSFFGNSNYFSRPSQVNHINHLLTFIIYEIETHSTVMTHKISKHKNLIWNIFMYNSKPISKLNNFLHLGHLPHFYLFCSLGDVCCPISHQSDRVLSS